MEIASMRIACDKIVNQCILSVNYRKKNVSTPTRTIENMINNSFCADNEYSNVYAASSSPPGFYVPVCPFTTFLNVNIVIRNRAPFSRYAQNATHIRIKKKNK